MPRTVTRTELVELYTIDELRELLPESFDRACDTLRSFATDDFQPQDTARELLSDVVDMMLVADELDTYRMVATLSGTLDVARLQQHKRDFVRHDDSGVRDFPFGAGIVESVTLSRWGIDVELGDYGREHYVADDVERDVRAWIHELSSYVIRVVRDELDYIEGPENLVELALINDYSFDARGRITHVGEPTALDELVFDALSEYVAVTESELAHGVYSLDDVAPRLELARRALGSQLV